ncbi:hypothetical protein IC617_13885 [Neiella sp. HB171785]|uniref:Uncharacterized protein n=1 Tax=Neiella litorisoli TaxID=2771431 RepID=A0A8J6QVI0_9GAMM|nr:hypothetical protein [Neiella litorisoli]MBD1390523.1 hypothetical protein [Neiella litorisoli]
MDNTSTKSSSNAFGRRKFLKKTSIGVALSTIPAKSIWASGNGNLIGSIQASAGSGWSPCGIALYSHGGWKNHYSSYSDAVLFGDAFPSGFVVTKDGDTIGLDDKFVYEKAKGHNPEQYVDQLRNATLTEVMGAESLIVNVFVQICAIYLNAKYHVEAPELDIEFPVYGPGKPFESLAALASWLLLNSLDIEGQPNTKFGKALSELIDNNHAPSTCS